MSERNEGEIPISQLVRRHVDHIRSAIVSLNRIVRNLVVDSLMRMGICFMSWTHGKTVIRHPIPAGPVLSLEYYSIINDSRMLCFVKRTCYTRRDTRAGWIGPGIPYTDSAGFRPWSDWATQHWAMYCAFLPFVRNIANGQILDVGCGLGHTTTCLATVLGTQRITAIDIDPVAIEFARRFNERSNVRYIRSDFLCYKPSQKYQYIFALEILEHLSSTQHYEFVDKCLSMLSDEGLLFLTTPNFPDEPDQAHAHIGLLNRERARSFIERYKHRIIDSSFIDNRRLLSLDPSQFIVRDPPEMFEDKSRNRSHFAFVMK